MNWVFKPSPVVGCPVLNQDLIFPVNNIYCVGRNYRDHVLEMGSNPDRESPFFFKKFLKFYYSLVIALIIQMIQKIYTTK